jgi:acyl-CoA synthetase (AMP-forming)/AMP-acid ligase II
MAAGRRDGAKITLGMTLWAAFAAVAGTRPDRVAVVADDGQLTAAGLAGEAAALSARLTDSGVQPGQHVLIMLPNSARYAATLFGVMRAGAIAVPLDPGLSQRELAQIVTATTPGAVAVGTERAAAAVAGLVPGTPVIGYHRLSAAPDAELPPAESPAADADPRSSAVMFFTSGTTGSPKGVVHSHRGLLASYLALQRLHGEFFEGTAVEKLRHVATITHRYGMRAVAAARGQTWFTPIPYYAIGGHEVLMGAILGGHRLVAMETFHPRRVMEAIQRERVTVFPATPAMVESVLSLSDFDRFDLSALLVVGLGGAPASPELVQRAQSRFGCSVTIGYGSTELGGGVLVTRIYDSEDVKRQTVGRPFPGTDVRIVDEEGQEVPVGVTGELTCRSETVMTRYALVADDATPPLEDGWYRTGDLAVRDKDGNLRIVGRRDDMIIRAGYKIQPAEIEQVLGELAGVRESAVVGVPAPKVGQQVWAFAVPEPGEASIDREALLAHCRANLSVHKIPDHLRICESLPTTPLGKVQRYRLTQMALAETQHTLAEAHRGQDEAIREA